MKNPILTTANGIRLSIADMYYRNECRVPAIVDAVEDSVTGTELVNRLNKLKLLEKYHLDRESPAYARLTATDCFGNKHYFRAEK